ncbi:MAG: phage tail protein [Ruminococcus sp.]|nr:phage tail protein [Ruminococcus sp.]
MLANGAKLGYKKAGATEYTDLPDLKEIPDMGVEPEKVDNTGLNDKNMQYENGIGDLGDMVYKFKYSNGATSAYRLMRELQNSGETASFQETLKDGTITTFDAQVSVKRTGGGVNGVIDCEVAMSIQSDLEVTDPV